jgi:hypothetical protein
MDLASALVRAGHLTRAVELLRSEPGRSKPKEAQMRPGRPPGELIAVELTDARAGIRGGNWSDEGHPS